MASPIIVSGLGTGGVQLTTSPLAMDDSELIQAQNAEPYRERGIAGIRKRQGLQRVVPTGSVVPSAAAGTIVGVVPINGNFGTSFSPGMMPIYIGITVNSGIFSVDGGVTFNPFTAPTGNNPPTPEAPLFGLPPNAKYALDGSYEFTPLYPAVRAWQWQIFGGHESGQVLGFDGTKIVELVRLAATGSVDDCLPLPGVWLTDTTAADSSDNITGRIWVVIALVGGGVQLYDVLSGRVIVLPSLPATATGSCMAGTGSAGSARLCVASGLSVYSINPLTETAWTTAFTASDTGISQLTGLSAIGPNVYVGTKSTSLPITLRIYKLVTAFPIGTLTRVLGGSGGTHDACEITQTTAPGYVFGPFPVASGGIYATYVGTTSALVQGYEGDGIFTGPVAILRRTGSAVWTANIDLKAAMGGSTSITVGPITLDSAYAAYQFNRYATTSVFVTRSSVFNVTPFAWQTISNTTPVHTTIYPFFTG